MKGIRILNTVLFQILANIYHNIHVFLLLPSEIQLYLRTLYFKINYAESYSHRKPGIEYGNMYLVFFFNFLFKSITFEETNMQDKSNSHLF